MKAISATEDGDTGAARIKESEALAILPSPPVGLSNRSKLGRRHSFPGRRRGQHGPANRVIQKCKIDAKRGHAAIADEQNSRHAPRSDTKWFLTEEAPNCNCCLCASDSVPNRTRVLPTCQPTRDCKRGLGTGRSLNPLGNRKHRKSKCPPSSKHDQLQSM